MEDWHNFGADYDKTLMAWYANFNAHGMLKDSMMSAFAACGIIIYCHVREALEPAATSYGKSCFLNTGFPADINTDKSYKQSRPPKPLSCPPKLLA